MTCLDCGQAIPATLIPTRCPACTKIANHLWPGGAQARIKLLEEKNHE